MERMNNEVNDWLTKVLEVRMAPNFELQPEIVYALNALRKRNIVENQRTLMITKDYKLKTAEFTIESKRKQSILTQLGIYHQKFSESCLAEIEDIAECCDNIDVLDASNTRILLAMSEHRSLMNEMNMENEMKSALFKKSAAIAEEAEKLCILIKNDIEVSRNELLTRTQKDTRKNILFMKDKIQEYKKFIDKYYKIHSHSDIEENMKAEVLMRICQENNIKRTENNKIEKKLKNLKDLPPDIHMAKVKVLEAQEELDKLEIEFVACVDKIDF